MACMSLNSTLKCADVTCRFLYVLVWVSAMNDVFKNYFLKNILK